MIVRSYSWFQNNLSWSTVMESLLHAIEQKGNLVAIKSTNGYKGMRYWNEDRAREKQNEAARLIRDQKQRYDLDITFTVPVNFPKRFLKDSRCRAALYAYESSIMPPEWKNFYHMVDYVMPPSQYVADMFIRNGCPAEKVQIVPYGVDPEIFNPSIKPMEGLGTEKKFKFLTVAEPHHRKQIDKMLDVYAKTFTSADDVCLIIKTKIFNNETIKNIAGYEQDLRPVLLDLKRRYGSAMPEVKILNRFIPDLGGLYTAANAFCLMSASEGWGIPYLEALASGLLVIAPNHGGQLEFLNEDNSLLTRCGTRTALKSEQYWYSGNPPGIVGNPDPIDFGAKMRMAFEDDRDIKDVKIPNALRAAATFTWGNAADRIIGLINGRNKVVPY